MSDLEQRTQPASPRRRREWRSRGQVATSAELGPAAGLLAAMTALHLAGPQLFVGLQTLLGRALRNELAGRLDPNWATSQIRGLALGALGLLAPLLAAVWLVCIFQGLLQSRFLFTWRPLSPDVTRLNPLAGLRRMSGTGVAARAGATVCRLLCLALVAGSFLSPTLIQHFDRSAAAGTAAFAAQMGTVLLTLAFRLAICSAILAIGDFMWQVWQYERSIRMTPQEAREELRQSEASPETRQRRRAMASASATRVTGVAPSERPGGRSQSPQ